MKVLQMCVFESFWVSTALFPLKLLLSVLRMHVGDVSGLVCSSVPKVDLMECRLGFL